VPRGFTESFITSVDIVKALGLLIETPEHRLSDDEMKILRRNIDTFDPYTIRKSNPDHAEAFKWITEIPAPRPIKVSKDVKIFPWKHLEAALTKVLQKHVRS
jgi:hypothetical protein